MTKPTIGIIGAGKLGTTLARLGARGGYEIVIANSKPASESAWIINSVAPDAKVLDTAGVLAAAEIIILAIPLSKYQTIDKHALDGKLVLDAMNYWWEVDGTENTVSSIEESSSEVMQNYFSGATWVKAFNHIGYHDLEIEVTRHLQEKKVVAFATDHPEVVEQVSEIIAGFGFDPYFLGALRKGQILEPGSPFFGADLTRPEFLEMLATIAESELGQRIIAARGSL